MKQRFYSMLSIAPALLLFSSSLAQGFYDPNLQRWISRDPQRENGFMAVAGGSKGVVAEEANPYSFTRNAAPNAIDAKGLTIYYCTRRTDWGIGRHGYLWDDRRNPNGGKHSCGQESAWGVGATSSPTDEGPGASDDVSCTAIPNSQGNEDDIMDYCRNHVNDQKLWWPGNDCHTAVDKVLTDTGFQSPPATRWNTWEQKLWWFLRHGQHGF